MRVVTVGEGADAYDVLMDVDEYTSEDDTARVLAETEAELTETQEKLTLAEGLLAETVRRLPRADAENLTKTRLVEYVSTGEVSDSG